MKKFIFLIICLIQCIGYSQAWFTPLQAIKDTTAISVKGNIYISKDEFLYNNIRVPIYNYYKENTITENNEIAVHITFVTQYGEILLSYYDYYGVSNLYIKDFNIDITLGYIDGTLLL